MLLYNALFSELDLLALFLDARIYEVCDIWRFIQSYVVRSEIYAWILVKGCCREADNIDMFGLEVK